MDSSQLRTGEIVAGIGGIALFVFLFFDWYSGGAEVTGNVLSGTASVSHPGISGWDALTDLPGFLIILSGVSGIALLALAAAGQRVNIPLQRGMFTATLGTLAVLLILWRMVAGSPTLKIGIFLGLAAAVAIAWGALAALMEGGFQPLVAAAGTRARTGAATAPVATPPAAPAGAPAAAKAQSSSSSGGATTTKRSTTKRSSTKPSTAKRSTTAKSSSRSSGGGRSGSRSSSSKSKSSSRSSGSRSSGSRSGARKK